jgi:hypothetical protein
MDKAAILTEIEGGFSELLTAAQALDERAMSRVADGTWTAKEVLAHITGWHRAMTGAMERMSRGERPTPEGVDYSDADAWNAGFAAGACAQQGATIIAGLQQSFANYLRAAQALPPDRFGEGKTVNRLLEASGYGHYREHLPALKTSGPAA